MARSYSEEDRQYGLEALRANGGSISLTSAQTGIPASTLRGWARREVEAGAADGAEAALAQLQPHLVESILRLAESLEARIDDAPLNQRASALAQLIDRLIRLAERLPHDASGAVVRIEYVDADGSVHNTPEWEREAGAS
jgi:transposase-like protein